MAKVKVDGIAKVEFSTTVEVDVEDELIAQLSEALPYNCVVDSVEVDSAEILD